MRTQAPPCRHPARQDIHVIGIDVTDDTSVGHGVFPVLEQAGRLDRLVNHAGIGVVERYC
jgi:NAD(P)-dependent dehydrogenase (short-subunit alcohol dehydrogenase family)